MSEKKTGRFLEFSKPFIEGAKSVFETMVFTDLHPQKPALKQDNTSMGDISAIMGLSGNFSRDDESYKFRGMMVISFPIETYCKIASSMLMEEYDSYTEEIGDVGAEISNIVTGNAKRSLKEIGYEIEMSTPSTVHGIGHSIKYPDKTVVVVIPMSCSFGEFFLELCYHDN